MSYEISEIKNITGAGGHIVRSADSITYLLTDSRNIIFPEQSLFIAIKGPHHDGHNYMRQAYDAGVRNYICERVLPQFPEDANILLTVNSVTALQQMAASHRRHFNADIAGITGSNGKTVVKEWLYHLLRTTRNICRNPKSYNSQTGVPLSVWQLEAQNDLGIFEAGISKPGEMEKLEAIIRPTLGIFTNIGAAHAEGFSSISEKISEKLKLFSGADMLILFYCCDQAELNSHIHATLHCSLCGWTRNDFPGAEVQVKNIRVQGDKTFFELHFKEKTILNLEIPFPDAASLENAVNAILAADHLGLDTDILREELKTLPVISMRLELKKGINGNRIINDVYSADLNSLEIAMQFLNTRRQGLETHVILSDIEQSGMVPGELYKKVGALLKENKIKRFTGIGPVISQYADQISGAGDMRSQFFASTDAFLTSFDENNYQREFILIKGARSFSLERISNELTEKTHGTILQVDLNHLIHNLQVYRSILKPGVKVMAMVKAFSYGSGTAEIAAALAYHHVDYLAVAYTDEGLELRKSGIHLPIMVMNPEEDTFEHILEYGLEPEIYNFRVLKLCAEAADRAGRTVKVHIKIDTGMHRLGFTADDMTALEEELQKQKNIVVASVFSHLAAADEKEETEFTKKQINEFDALSQHLISQLGYPVLRHILNSSGISGFPEGQFDMVRLGIGLYGYDPSEIAEKNLLPVSYLYTTISQIKTVQAGESIGYGRSAVAEHTMRIATLNIGYADGFSRRLSNGRGHVFINGRKAAVVGRVCMDMIMVDISDIEHVQEGDRAEIFGEHITLQQYAQMMETIPYEVLTGISQRVKRVYIQE